jgi:hypothetical protein
VQTSHRPVLVHEEWARGYGDQNCTRQVCVDERRTRSHAIYDISGAQKPRPMFRIVWGVRVGALARDNRTLYLGARTAPSAPVTSIVGVDIATGEDRTIVTIEGGLPQSQPGIAPSPDGSTLAAYGWRRARLGGGRRCTNQPAGAPRRRHGRPPPMTRRQPAARTHVPPPSATNGSGVMQLVGAVTC